MNIFRMVFCLLFFIVLFPAMLMANDECEGIASQMHSVMEQMDQLTKAYNSKT